MQPDSWRYVVGQRPTRDLRTSLTNCSERQTGTSQTVSLQGVTPSSPEDVLRVLLRRSAFVVTDRTGPDSRKSLIQLRGFVRPRSKNKRSAARDYERRCPPRFVTE